jgi:hypothetical protein
MKTRKRNIDIIWQRITNCQEQNFNQIQGKTFTYHANGNRIKLSTTNQNIEKSSVEEALNDVPLINTVPVQHLRAPSYLYAILMDKRIRGDDW